MRPVRLTGCFLCLWHGLSGGGGLLMGVLGGHAQKGEHRELVSLQARHAHYDRPEAVVRQRIKGFKCVHRSASPGSSLV